MTISYSIYESACLMPLHEVSLDALCSPEDENLAFQPASDDHVTIENSVDLKQVHGWSLGPGTICCAKYLLGRCKSDTSCERTRCKPPHGCKNIESGSSQSQRGAV